MPKFLKLPETLASLSRAISDQRSEFSSASSTCLGFGLRVRVRIRVGLRLRVWVRLRVLVRVRVRLRVKVQVRLRVRVTLRVRIRLRARTQRALPERCHAYSAPG